MLKRLMVIVMLVASFVAFQVTNPCWAGDEYVLGFLGDITGPCRSFYGPEAEGCRLYIETVNAAGGINGRKIKLLVEDGKSNPALSAAIAKKMIEKDDVLGICGLGISASQLPVFELSEKAGVPVLCGYSCAYNAASVKPGSVVFSTGYVMTPEFHPGGYQYALVVKDNFPKTAKVAVGGYSSPGARVWYEWTKDFLQNWGYDVVYECAIPPGTVEFSSWVNKIAELKPDVFTICVGGEIMIPFLPALEKAGWTNDILIPYGVIESDVVKARERLVGNGEWILWITRYASKYDLEEVPEFRKIAEAINKYGNQFPLSAEHAQGWTMGRLLEAALIKAGWPCSRGALLSALESIELDTKGLSGGPIRFSPTDHYGTSWWKIYRWNDSKKALVSFSDWFKIESNVKKP